MKPKIDWYNHYRNKNTSLNFKKKDLKNFYRQNKDFVNAILKTNPKNVIEVGCGLARDSFLLGQKRIRVTIFDIDKRFLKLAHENAKEFNVKLNEIHGNFFKISKFVKKDYFDLAFHSGVLEHYSNKEIKQILREQLKVVSKIIFSVPIYSKDNLKYFNDNVYRRLLTIEEWKNILSEFKISKFNKIRTRHDDLLIGINR